MHAVTTELADPVDLDGVFAGTGYLFVRDGAGFAGQGVAARVPLDRIDEALGTITHEGPGPGPLAFGALAFTPGAPGELVVPAVLVRRDRDGCCTLTAIDGATAPLGPAAPPPARAGAFSVRPGVDPETYLAAVRAAREAVRRGELTKAVIARDVIVEADAPLDPYAIALRLRASFGSSYRYAFDGLLGASPELLVERRGDVVRSHPLAGTAPRTGDPATDARLAAELIASTKNQVEHRVVIDMVHDTLLPWCSYLDEEAEPSVLAVANVAHLGTAMEGRLSTPAPSALTMARALSPTPALGGHPNGPALALIAAVEGFDRGRYGGAIGWVDATGDGTWAVTIRCAELAADRRSARLFAGGGIVADSEPIAELAETQAKFQAMLSAIVRP